MRDYLDKVTKADQCALYVEYFGIASDNAEKVINNLRATFQGTQKAAFKELLLTMHKCHFGTTEIEFLGRIITPAGVKPRRPQVQIFL